MSALWGACDVLVTEGQRLADEVGRVTGLDVQSPDVFLTYAVDVDLPRAARALVGMARTRWIRSLDGESADYEVRARLIKWARENRLPSLAEILDQADVD
ncbi:hypothetical protein [Streptoalloteichus hindustanus]|uniref:Uncharacterized protein n=1 Tax=Streptoalloteichus hindustanus TaxID=2017 RepID=A0A1M5PE67_STRHI|nr:hypothetical protein [Streptoalloteichus hindustanus]SHH00018.1 hypothetical protein SAMN05444320_11826 [Streptoalloteichus hindustanus]